MNDLDLVTLDQLRTFLVVARLGKVTAAAREMNKTQSAVSASIKALEQRYGLQLFDRIGRDIILNTDGRRFVDHAGAVVREADRAEAMLADFSDTPSGPLRIAASQTVATYWLPPLLAQFHAQYPRVDIALGTHNTSGAVAALIRGDADIGVVEGRVQDTRVRSEVVATDRLAIVVGRDHPWADREDLQTGDLAKTSWVMREPGSGTREAAEDAFRALGVVEDDIRKALILPSNEACLAAVSSGHGATVVSLRSAWPHIESGVLSLARFAMPDREFRFVLRRQDTESRLISEFTRLLMDSATAGRQSAGQ